MRPIRYWSLFVIALLAIASLGPGGVQAQEKGLSVTPQFTHVVQEQGKEVKMDLTLRNPTEQAVGVLVEWAKRPEPPWSAEIEGEFKDYGVLGVSVPAEDPVTLELTIAIPEEAEPGDHTFTLAARSPEAGFERTVPITVTVEARAPEEKGEKGLEIEPEFPFLEGPTDSTFEFAAELSNNTEKDVKLELGAKPVNTSPQGWSISFKPEFEEKRITSVGVKSGSNETVEMEVDPPFNAKPGEYGIRFTASAEGSQPLVADFGVRLTGKPDLNVGTASGRLNVDAPAGRETPFNLLVHNAGTGPVRNVELAGQPPQGWDVSVDPPRLGALEPDQVQQVTVRLTPPEDAIPGDYSVTVRGTSPDDSATVDLSVAVTQSTIWGWVGLGIVIIVVGGLVGLFVRLGRR